MKDTTGKITIGAVQLENSLMLAPMAGITDVPFRELAKEGGAGLVYTEMVSAKALTYGDRKTRRIMDISSCERPVSVQIFGGEPAVMAEAARIVEDSGADIIDINFGCPARKINKSGAGVCLVENEAAVTGIMTSVVNAVKIPVTIKVRLGLTPEENTAPRMVRLAEECGVQLVAVHGRPASSGHSGLPDFGAIAAAVAESRRIPVIGNGGIVDEPSARHFLDATGCSGLMIGRAAIGDPGIFRRIGSFISSGVLPDGPTWEDRIAFLKRHAARADEHYGSAVGILRLRKVAPFYLKGLPNASRIRNEFNKMTRLEDLERLLETIWQSPYFGDDEMEGSGYETLPPSPC